MLLEHELVSASVAAWWVAGGWVWTSLSRNPLASWPREHPAPWALLLGAPRSSILMVRRSHGGEDGLELSPPCTLLHQSHVCLGEGGGLTAFLSPHKGQETTGKHHGGQNPGSQASWWLRPTPRTREHFLSPHLTITLTGHLKSSRLSYCRDVGIFTPGFKNSYDLHGKGCNGKMHTAQAQMGNGSRGWEL